MLRSIGTPWARVTAGERRLALLCAGLIVNLALQPWRGLTEFAQTDFLAFLSGARLLRDGGCLYCLESQRITQQAISGHPLPPGQARQFLNPPIVAFVLRPLLALPAHLALGVFMLISLGALAVGGCWLAGTVMPATVSAKTRAAVVIVGVCSLPAAWGIALGQLDPLLFLAVAGSLVLIRRHPVAAGGALGVLTIKPQLVVLIPPALVIGRHWRVLLGVLIAGAVVLVTTPLPIWVRYVGRQEALLPVDFVSLPGVVGRAAAGRYPVAIVGILAGCAVLWNRRGVLRRDPRTAVALALTLVVLAAPHILAYDLVLLAVPLALWGSVRPGAAIAGGLLLSLTYFMDTELPGRLAHVETLAVVGVAVGMFRATSSDCRRPTA